MVVAGKREIESWARAGEGSWDTGSAERQFSTSHGHSEESTPHPEAPLGKSRTYRVPQGSLLEKEDTSEIAH